MKSRLAKKMWKVMAMVLTMSFVMVTTVYAAQLPQGTGPSLRGKTAGSSVYFGRFEQDGNAANGAEPIEWIVLANDGTKALLLSKNILENLSYLHTYENITWERSDVRSWMNGTFYNGAFNDMEKTAVLTVTNTNPASDDFYGGAGLPGGDDTVDKVFALSAYEAKLYLGAGLSDWNARMQACPTTYAMMKGCWTNGGSGRGFWWLRTPGNAYGNFTSVVQDHGGVVSHVGVSAGEGARPAIWVANNGF